MGLDSLLKLESKILTYSNDQILVHGKLYHFAIDFNNDILLVCFALRHHKRPTADPRSFPIETGSVKGRVHPEIHSHHQQSKSEY